MIKCEEIEKTIKEKKLVSITCDKCKKEFDLDDVFERQEFHHIHFTGGYGSVFGDEHLVRCDICQHCLKEMIKDVWRDEE